MSTERQTPARWGGCSRVICGLAAILLGWACSTYPLNCSPSWFTRCEPATSALRSAAPQSAAQAPPFPIALWPPKPGARDMHPTAEQSLRGGGLPAGLDFGAVRFRESGWEIIVPATPGGWKWAPFDPRDSNHVYAANAFARVGRGWSFGPFHGMHSEARGYFAEVYGRQPSDMELLDLEHDRNAFKALEARAIGGGGEPQPVVDPAAPVIAGAEAGRPAESLAYTVETPCVPSRWTWSAEGGIITGRGRAVQISWPAAGTYTVTARGTGGGCGAAAKVVRIGDALPPPTQPPPPLLPPTQPPPPVTEWCWLLKVTGENATLTAVPCRGPK